MRRAMLIGACLWIAYAGSSQAKDSLVGPTVDGTSAVAAPAPEGVPVDLRPKSAETAAPRQRDRLAGGQRPSTFALPQPTPLLGAPGVSPRVVPMSGIVRFEVRDGDRVEVLASTQELTRLTFEGDRAVAARTIEREDGPSALFEADEATGDLYLRLVRVSGGERVSLFVTMESGNTYLIVAVATLTPATSVVLAGLDVARPDEPQTAQDPELQLAASGPNDQVVSLMRSLYLDAPLVGYVRAAQRGRGMVGLLAVTQETVLSGDKLVGRVLVVRNPEDRDLPIEIEKLKTNGKRLVASGADASTVGPGQSVRVFLVEER